VGMEDSVEFGWMIMSRDGGDYAGPLFENLPESDDGFLVPVADGLDVDVCNPLSVETHPEISSRVFVSWSSVCHGMPAFDEPEDLGAAVREFIASGDPEAYVGWGLVVTRR